jgi:tryptophan synthase alpha chain
VVGQPNSTAPIGAIRQSLDARVGGGGKCLVPYLTAGLPNWERCIEAVSVAGADAIEIGIPFSDPVMDGPVIQEASQLALDDGMTPVLAIDSIGRLDSAVPLAVMTYYNLVFRHGEERFAADLVAAGISGTILPDLPIEESDSWAGAARFAGVENILLAAPTSGDDRLERITSASEGFVYAVGLLGVTGVRDALAGSALEIARRLKQVTDKPVLVGVGVGSPEQAVEACSVADGVVVGSRVVAEMMATGSAEAVADLVGQFRSALEVGAFA